MFLNRFVSSFKRIRWSYIGLLLVLPLLFGFGPFRQTTIPDPASFLIYGVPWALVGIVILGLLQRYASITDEVKVLISAGWSVVGYVILQNLPAIESVLPWLPVYLPQVLIAILIFGAQLGLIPGTTARRIGSLFVRRNG